MAKAFGINELLAANFNHLELSPQWEDLFGKLQTNATILISGPPKNGKTDFAIKLTKELALKGRRIFYDSYEEGKSSTLQEAVRRNDMTSCSGKVIFGNREPFDVVMKRMTTARSGNVLVLDSWDYLKLTASQFQVMRATLKNKLIIILCWAKGERPDNAQAKKIEHQVDVLIQVKDHRAKCTSRFGGNGEFVIWDKPRKANQQTSLFN